MRACLGGRLGHAIGLGLEGARSVDHQAHAQRAQPVGQAGRLVVQRDALRAVAQGVRQGLGAGGIAACHQQFDAMVGGRVARQCAADACAKVAVAAQDQGFEGCHRSGPARLGVQAFKASRVRTGR